MPHDLALPKLNDTQIHHPQRRRPALRKHRPAAAKCSGWRCRQNGCYQDDRTRLAAEVDANLLHNEPLWRETGDGHGTTLVATEAGLLAIGIEPVVAKAVVAILEHAAPKPPAQRAGTKQTQIIGMLQRPEGATNAEIVEATG